MTGSVLECLETNVVVCMRCQHSVTKPARRCVAQCRSRITVASVGRNVDSLLKLPVKKRKPTSASGRTRPDGHLVFSMAAAQVLKGNNLSEGEDLLAQCDKPVQVRNPAAGDACGGASCRGAVVSVSAPAVVASHP